MIGCDVPVYDPVIFQVYSAKFLSSKSDSLDSGYVILIFGRISANHTAGLIEILTVKQTEKSGRI